MKDSNQPANRSDGRLPCAPFRFQTRAWLRYLVLVATIGAFSMEPTSLSAQNASAASTAQNASAASNASDLIAVLRQDSDDPETLHAKSLACQKLGDLGPAEAADALASLLTDARLCAVACTALVNLPVNADGEPAGLKPLLASVPVLSKDASQRKNLMTVVNALGQLRSPAAIETLKSLDAQNDSRLAHSIQIALDKIAVAPSKLASLPVVALPNPIPPRETWPALADLDRLYQSELAGKAEDAAELTLLCRICEQPNECVDALVKKTAGASDSQKARLVELIAETGTRYAADALYKLTLTHDPATVDAVTKALGDWTTIDAADALLTLAKEYPEQKFRIRALRGYIRLARQLGGVSLDKKRTMLNEAQAVASRQEEKDLITEAMNHAILPAIERTRIFDGKTFGGWEGDTAKTFRLENGAIIGGSATERIPRNEFICTKIAYSDFVLTLECKLTGDGGNAGVQFRSVRIPNHHEMIGYQADLTTDGEYSGRLYDESRRKRFLVESADDAQRRAAYKINDWNTYKIVCEGKRIRLFLNGVLTVDYTESDDSIPLRGIIGLQIHAGPPSEAAYRNIFLERLD